MTEGWIKLHRKFLEWEWIQDPKMVSLFIHILIHANHEQKRWKGVLVDRGQMITGLRSLSANTGISMRSLRTCLERLKSTHEVTIKTTHKFSIITITKWDTYQGYTQKNDTVINTVTDTQPTHNRHTTDNKQEVKKERSIIPPSFFEDFWKIYPSRNGKKVGKAECLIFCKSFTNGDGELVMRAAHNYSKSKEAKEGFARDPIRFLKKDYWKDWIEQVTQQGDSEFL